MKKNTKELILCFVFILTSIAIKCDGPEEDYIFTKVYGGRKVRVRNLFLTLKNFDSSDDDEDCTVTVKEKDAQRAKDLFLALGIGAKNISVSDDRIKLKIPVCKVLLPDRSMFCITGANNICVVEDDADKLETLLLNLARKD